MPNKVEEVLEHLKDELDSFIESASQGHLEMDADDAQSIRAALTFQSAPEETYVLVVAKHIDPRKNSLTRIKCSKGVALGAYAYDNVNESYCVECADHFALGIVPISFKAILGSWERHVPMSEAVLFKYLNSQQKEHLKQYKSKFPADKFTFELVQLLH